MVLAAVGSRNQAAASSRTAVCSLDTRTLLINNQRCFLALRNMTFIFFSLNALSVCSKRASSFVDELSLTVQLALYFLNNNVTASE